MWYHGYIRDVYMTGLHTSVCIGLRPGGMARGSGKMLAVYVFTCARVASSAALIAGLYEF